MKGYDSRLCPASRLGSGDVLKVGGLLCIVKSKTIRFGDIAIDFGFAELSINPDTILTVYTPKK